MVAPTAAFFLVFCYMPMAGLLIAFKELFLGVGPLHSPWVGLDNFHRLLDSPDFTRSVVNTVVIGGLKFLAGFAAPIVLALSLNEVRSNGYRRSIQTLVYLPYFFSWVILGGIFLMLFSGDGPINGLIRASGHSPVAFLSDPSWFLSVLVVTSVYQSAGYGAVIYLAALAGIDPHLYEAASVDGAGRWRQVRSITLPGLAPTIVVLMILTLGNVLNAGFDQIYNMVNPVVYASADIIDTYALRRMFDMDYGLATATGLFKSGASLVLVASANALARRVTRGEQGLW
ncbi:sugar ABC transporter permease [bacterium]|nr:MAG: sugar ABC transporter permease [bacterium]